MEILQMGNGVFVPVNKWSFSLLNLMYAPWSLEQNKVLQQVLPQTN